MATRPAPVYSGDGAGPTVPLPDRGSMPTNPILIVARDPTLRADLESALSDAGFICTVVTSPADGVGALRARRFDLIVAEGLAASGAIGGVRAASGALTPLLVV